LSRPNALVALALAAGAAVLALGACGGADAAGALDQAKARLVSACQEGSSSALDRRLCRCIADEASKRPEYDTAAKLDALREDEDGDTVPAALGQVAMTCADQAGGG
jgi:hypothetical protein